MRAVGNCARHRTSKDSYGNGTVQPASCAGYDGDYCWVPSVMSMAMESVMGISDMGTPNWVLVGQAVLAMLVAIAMCRAAHQALSIICCPHAGSTRRGFPTVVLSRRILEQIAS